MTTSASHFQNSHFRSDINGLRAIAVIAVLLFHLEINYFRGGFLGVDIFLVISGYLISKTILTELQGSTFNLFTFYTKRFKRLVPAFFFTLTLSLFIGYLTLTPLAFERLGQSAMSCVLFYSNVHFLNETGYFDTESAFKPLLHIWSLSLEEQFYFIWPLTLFVLYRVLKSRMYFAVILLAILSLYLAQSTINAQPEKAFYLLPFRFFQFLLGAACIWIEKSKLFRGIVKELIFVLGFGMIILSVIVFNSKTQMPGLLSLIPCGGAMLIICAGNPTYSGWMVRNKFSEIIGRSSYSIYLAHWPIIVFYKYYTLSELTKYSAGILGIASIFVGIAMWYFIENPFRTSKIKLFKLDLVWIWMPVIMYVLYTFSNNIVLNKGYPSRYSAEFLMNDEEIAQNREKYWLGANSEKEVLKGSSSKKIAVFGNSFSVDLIYALRKNGLTASITSIQTTHRCYNFSEVALVKEDKQFCSEVNNNVFMDTSWLHADAIYLFDHWPKFEPNSLKQVLLKIRTHSKAPIYVFGPKMVFTRPVPEIVHACNSASAFAINKFAQTYAEKTGRLAVNNLLLKFFNDKNWEAQNIFYINVLNVLGGNDYMYDVVSRKNSKFLYFDPSHFTDQGALEFGEKLKSSYPILFN